MLPDINICEHCGSTQEACNRKLRLTKKPCCKECPNREDWYE